MINSFLKERRGEKILKNSFSSFFVQRDEKYEKI